MLTPAIAQIKKIQRDEKGSVAVIFGLMSATIFMFCGVAIDIGRASHSNTRLSQSLDAAALAAVKGMRLEGLSDDDAITLAQKVFASNMASSAGNWTNTGIPVVSVDRATWTAKIDVSAQMKTAFAGIIGIPTFTLAKSATATFDIKDIEVSVQLDLTGSMCQPCSKISALRSATADLLDILLPDGGTPNLVRVALAPFVQSVNAGALAGPATNYRSTDGCVFESSAANPNTDAAPGNGSYLKVAGDAGVTSTKGLCPNASKVIPLSDDKVMLKKEVSKYVTYNSTAGHLGTSWSWYLLSPNWASLMPSQSKPVAYNDGKTKKIAILMTDGVYNTVGGIMGNGHDAISADSQNRAKTMCDNMKKEGIEIYTVGFDLTNVAAVERPAAIATLKACASSADKYYQADDAAQLTSAFQSIATHIMSIRLAS